MTGWIDVTVATDVRGVGVKMFKKLNGLHFMLYAYLTLYQQIQLIFWHAISNNGLIIKHNFWYESTSI